MKELLGKVNKPNIRQHIRFRLHPASGTRDSFSPNDRKSPACMGFYGFYAISQQGLLC